MKAFQEMHGEGRVKLNGKRKNQYVFFLNFTLTLNIFLIKDDSSPEAIISYSFELNSLIS